MNLIPELTPGDMEGAGWYPLYEEHPGLEGKVIPLEDLKDVMSEVLGSDEELIAISKNEDYTVYGFRPEGKGMRIKFAYLCHHCEHLILGQPRVVDDVSIRDNIPLAGREGYDVYCNECGTYLEGFTGMMS